MGFYSETIFPWMLDQSSKNPNLQLHREALVADASGDVLEIGFGTGATLQFYDRDKVRSLSVVEPSEGMNKRALARIEAMKWPVTVKALAGENLPFPDESFDCVVACLTLCSVSDPARVLSEIRRVLRPGGSFRFFEHVASENVGCRKWQERLTPINKVIGVGCHLNRDTVASVRQAGFELGPIEQKVEPIFPMAAFFPFVQASATKAL